MALGFRNGITAGAVASAHLNTPAATEFGAGDAGAWKTFAGAFVNDFLKEFAIIGGKLTYLGESGRYVIITYSGSVTSTTATTVISFNIELNGTIVADGRFYSAILAKSAGDSYYTGARAVLQLNYGDEIVIVCSSDKASTDLNAVSFTTIATQI